MDTTFDLDAYLHRIGYTGARTATAATLKEIHRRHAMTFPFENINTLMGWPVPLDTESLQKKMVQQGRGGYCFEQNLLLQNALQSMGFTVTGLSARVLSNREITSLPPRTHMLLKIDVDGTSYIGDVGFGGMTLVDPIRFELNVVQPTSHESRRLVPIDDEFFMEARVDDAWRTLYRFHLAANYVSDYELSNWYICTHPNSHFTKGLTVARPTPEGRYALRNNDFAVHPLNGETKRTTIDTVTELKNVLEQKFLLRVPDSDELDERLARLIADSKSDEK